MLIQKNVKTSFLLNAGRDRSSANGWAASYQLLDKSGNVIFLVGGGYTTQDMQEIGNGLYGVAMTFGAIGSGFVRWKIVKGADTLYSVEPYTVLHFYGNKGVEQTYVANFGKTKAGKSVDYRVLKDDLSEERTWNNTGLVELGAGIYGVALTINSVLTGYIQYRDNTDGLYISDPVLVFDYLNVPVIQTGPLSVSFDSPGINISMQPKPAAVVIADKKNIGITVKTPEAMGVRTDRTIEVRVQ